MSTRTRFTFWVAAVGGCALSPVLWHAIAPWAGAAWQCLCLGAIIALYATTPVDAIRLPKWLSKTLIVGGMVAWPAMCYGRVTWALVVATLVVALFDHFPLTFTRPEGKKDIRITARWSWRPGVACDWLATSVLWSPVMWVILSGARGFALPEWSIPASFYCLMFMFVFQMPENLSRQARPRIPQRVGMATVFLAVGVFAVVGYAMHGGAV